MSFKFQLALPEINFPVRIQHGQKIMLSGSCFTEHIGQNLRLSGFEINSNPHGNLFNPLRVIDNLSDCVENRQYDKDGLLQERGIWHHWDFHSRFSDTDPDRAIARMNASVNEAHDFLKQADWLFLTLGSAFQYMLKEGDASRAVANCHRVGASQFERQLCDIEEMVDAFTNLIQKLKAFNPGIHLVLTVSPVRHIREGVLENNRSKARLIETVARVTEEYPHIFYFPAYEAIIDVLRDYRFYDIDLVHPNFAATQFVWQYFETCFFSPETQALSIEVQEINRALKHKPRFPRSEAHIAFRATMLQKIQSLQSRNPKLDLTEALAYFGK